MRILRHGVLPETKVYRGECGHCKAIFEFHRHEARFSSDQRDGDFLTIPCPTCKRDVFVNANNAYVGPG